MNIYVDYNFVVKELQNRHFNCIDLDNKYTYRITNQGIFQNQPKKSVPKFLNFNGILTIYNTEETYNLLFKDGKFVKLL